jgi:hypothetical protein
LSGSLSNQTADSATYEPGGADADFGFAAHDITPVILKAKRPYTASSKALGFYLCGRHDNGTMNAEHLSGAIINKVWRV